MQNIANTYQPDIDAFDALSHKAAVCKRILLAELQKNANRITRLAMTFLPLMFLLVGSCKTAELPGAYGSSAAPEQFRIALFPDSVAYEGDNYKPAAGYVSRARSFVSGYPDTVMMLTSQEVAVMFGQPTFVRADADAKIWQYQDKDCVLEFYFYESTTGEKKQAPAVSFYDVRSKTEITPGMAEQGLQPLPNRQKSKCFEKVQDKGDFSSTRI